MLSMTFLAKFPIVSLYDVYFVTLNHVASQFISRDNAFILSNRALIE